MFDMDTQIAIDSMRIRFGQDVWFSQPTTKQLGYLNGLINKALVDKTKRYDVISAILGYHVSTTHLLTRWVASVLIENLQGEDGVSLVRSIETSLKAEAIL